MKNKPLVSVIIPAYNAGPYLPEAVNSVLNQTYTSLELIVVDDASDDGSLALLDEIKDARLKIMKQEKGGAAKARNRAIEASSGDFLAFLDADDLWHREKLEKQMHQYNQNNVNMVFSLMQEFLDVGTMKVSFPEHFYGDPLTGLSSICLLISRNDFQRAGSFDNAIEVGDFIDWFERAKLAGLNYFVIQETLAFRRIHHGNMDRLRRSNVKQYVAVVKAALDRKRNRV